MFELLYKMTDLKRESSNEIGFQRSLQYTKDPEKFKNVHDKKVTERLTKPISESEIQKMHDKYMDWLKSKQKNPDPKITDYEWTDKNPQKAIDHKERYYNVVVGECRKCENMKRNWEEDYGQSFNSYTPSIMARGRKSKKSKKSK
jgi:hypothetical protein